MSILNVFDPSCLLIRLRPLVIKVTVQYAIIISGPPSKPCHISSNHMSCDSASLTWYFPQSVVVDSYYVRYRVKSNAAMNSTWTLIEEASTNMSTVEAVINDLEPLLTYEVLLQGSNAYGNGTFSDPIEIASNIPGKLIVLLFTLNYTIFLRFAITNLKSSNLYCCWECHFLMESMLIEINWLLL